MCYLLALTLSMSLADFIDVQTLSPDDLRTRFKLQPSCEPSVTASMADPASSSVMVAIECRARPVPPTSIDSGSGQPPRP